MVELMVVVVLIGILSAMIIPELRGTRADAALRATAREFVSAFGIAGSRAACLHREHRVRFDTASGRYVVEQRNRSGSPEEFSPVRDVPGCDGKWDARISVEVRAAAEEAEENSKQDSPRLTAGDSGNSISFQPDGTADGVTVLLRDPDGFRLALQINPVTSRTSLAELGRP